YQNRGNGTFTDVTAAAGVPNRHWGKGALAADFDNDGFQDLYIVNYGPNVLYLNNRDGSFRNVTAKAGVNDARWSAAAAAADYDKDGDLDLFVANYLDYDLNNLPAEGKFCSYQNLPVACGPRGLKGAGDTLYRNDGDGTFTDVSKEAGVSDGRGYYGLAAAWGDYDNDGDPDLFVANDNTPNYLYRNNGDGTFSDAAIEAGVAFSEDGREQSCMGVVFEDLDNDGWLDVMVTNFSDDYNTLYRNTGKGYFRDDSYRAGLADSWRDLSWGVGFFDFDNNGWKDVFVANGHIYPQVDSAALNISYKQTNKLYLNRGEPKLVNVSAQAGSGLQIAKSHRGAAFADFNNDGQIDVALSALDDAPSLLMNKGAGENHHWILVRLEGSASNRFGVGARITVKSSGRTQIREVKAGGSYASSNDPRAHFGLGPVKTVDELVVAWPSGKITKLGRMDGDRILTVRE
ncbi:MAG: CRTAC1 family protein, partial [Bryobacteraceae bacterium]